MDGKSDHRKFCIPVNISFINLYILYHTNPYIYYHRTNQYSKKNKNIFMPSKNWELKRFSKFKL